MAEDIEPSTNSIPIGQFENLADLLAISTSMQVSIIILAVGLIGLFAFYTKFSKWIGAQKISYTRPHLSKFIQTALLPVFAIILVSSISAYIQISVLDEDEITKIISQYEHAENSTSIDPRETFAKILNSITIVVIGFAIAKMIPIILNKRQKSDLEKEDYGKWKDMRGFEDDKDGLFHRLFEWIPPKKMPSDMTKEEFDKLLQTKEGRRQLEHFRTSKGQSIGTFKPLKDNPFEEWKKSERAKYEKYFQDCTSGDNESGQKLSPGAIPKEIFSIDTWREEKRLGNHEPIVPGAKSPGYAAKQREGMPKSLEHAIPIIFITAVAIGIISWWGVDLFVLGTVVAGLGVGIGFALKETMENLFAYIMIRKDKIFIEGDRVEIDGYNGNIYKITSRVTYVRHALNESMGIFPTRQLITTKVINYTKEMKFVPAMVAVGVSYLNNARQVTAILTKIGKRAMQEVKDEKGNHLVVQKRCPYLKENKPSCGCDKDVVMDLKQPVVRFDEFNSSSLDFRLWVYVKEYKYQFKVETAMRIMMQEEFQKYDIRIPWPIRTIYQGDEKREAEEINQVDKDRASILQRYGTGDISIDES